MGKSAQQVQVDSVTGYLSKAQQNAFSIGGQGDPQQESANYLSAIAKYLVGNEWANVIGQIMSRPLMNSAASLISARGS